MQRNNTTPQAFIVFGDSVYSPEARKMVVIDGQPYYQSTGINSGAPRVWLPFILLRGFKPLYFDNLPSIYNKELFEEVLDQTPFNYIVKFEKTNLSEKCETLAIDIYDGRIPTKTTLITSCRLRGGVDPHDHIFKAGLDFDEINLAQVPIQLANKPDFQTTDPDKINEWLIKQGATTIELFLTKPNKESSHHPSTLFTKKELSKSSEDFLNKLDNDPVNANVNLPQSKS